MLQISTKVKDKWTSRCNDGRFQIFVRENRKEKEAQYILKMIDERLMKMTWRKKNITIPYASMFFVTRRILLIRRWHSLTRNLFFFNETEKKEEMKRIFLHTSWKTSMIPEKFDECFIFKKMNSRFYVSVFAFVWKYLMNWNLILLFVSIQDKTMSKLHFNVNLYRLNEMFVWNWSE